MMRAMRPLSLIRLLSSILLLGSAACLAAEPASPAGVWKTFDDDTHAAKALIQIDEHDGELSGRIVKLFRAPHEIPDPTCTACRGARHDQPVLGMTILWGMRRDGDGWSGGEILDPEDGAVYRASLHLDRAGGLSVRGYIGVSLLGRTQTWQRATP